MMIAQDIKQLESQLSYLLDKHRQLQEEVIRLRRTIAKRDAENRMLDQKLTHVSTKLEQFLRLLPMQDSGATNNE